MARPQIAVPIGTVQRPWKRLIDRATGFCTNNSGTFAASTYGHKITLPATAASSGIFVVSPDACNQIIFSFWGKAAAGTFTADLYALRNCECPRLGEDYTEYRGSHIGTLTPTLGAGAIESGSLIYPEGTVFAESIAKTVDKPYGGFTVYADETAGTAIVAGDFTGASRLLVALKLSTATHMGFDWCEI